MKQDKAGSEEDMEIKTESKQKEWEETCICPCPSREYL
jgi:hypothetical protein